MKIADVFRDRTAVKELLDPADPRFLVGSPEDRDRERAEWRAQRFAAEVFRSGLPSSRRP